MTVLKFQHVCKNYAQHRVLNQIDLTVEAGECVGLVGVNGAGKTTLLKAMLDFCDISTGQIEIFEHPHTSPQARQALAFLPEQLTPPYFLSGKQFLTYLLRLQGQVYTPAKAAQLCDMLDFEKAMLTRSVKRYSKGMLQKLGLIACLLSDKPLLVLDEPMSGLDPRARAYLRDYLSHLKQQGTTLFFTTHLLTDIEAICDRMAILHNGHLQFVGTPAACCQYFAVENLEAAYLKAHANRASAGE